MTHDPLLLSSLLTLLCVADQISALLDPYSSLACYYSAGRQNTLLSLLLPTAPSAPTAAAVVRTWPKGKQGIFAPTSKMQLLAILASASIATAFVGPRASLKSSRLHENFGFGESCNGTS